MVYICLYWFISVSIKNKFEHNSNQYKQIQTNSGGNLTFHDDVYKKWHANAWDPESTTRLAFQSVGAIQQEHSRKTHNTNAVMAVLSATAQWVKDVLRGLQYEKMNANKNHQKIKRAFGLRRRRRRRQPNRFKSSPWPASWQQESRQQLVLRRHHSSIRIRHKKAFMSYT